MRWGLGWGDIIFRWKPLHPCVAHSAVPVSVFTLRNFLRPLGLGSNSFSGNGDFVLRLWVHVVCPVKSKRRCEAPFFDGSRLTLFRPVGVKALCCQAGKKWR